MSESQGSGLFSLRNLAIIVALVIAAIGHQEFQHNWVNMPPLTPDRFPSRPFTVHEIPTTYYQVGELGDVLDGWHKGSYLKGYIHLYRVAPNSKPFVFDTSVLTAKAQVEDYMDPCPNMEATMCKTCLDTSQHIAMNVSQILAAPTNFYSSFGKLDDSPSIRQLVKSVNIPNFNYKMMKFEHAFIGNFPTDRLTTYVHANSATSSMSVQYVGGKHWLFFPPEVMKNPDMLHAAAAVGISLPTKSPDGHFDVYFVDTQPGDIIFFSENWGHVVYNKKGPNVMFTFRRLTFDNFFRQPFRWFHAVMNSKIYPTKYNIGRQRTPFNALFNIYIEKLHNLCAGGVLAPWDADMLDLVKNGPKK